MPTINVNDINIYYEVHGEGEPLVLIGGLANDITDYTDHTTIIPELSQHYTVIAFDNRGVGRTDKPDAPYSIEMMAEDTVGLLDALGITKAHLLGISMGGRIALALTLRHPERVNALVLASTGARVVRTWWRTIVLTMLQQFPFLRGKDAQPSFAFRRQVAASAAYDCTDRLHEIHAPTLIMHGKTDKVASYEMAREMPEKIQGSEMITFDGGHLFLFFRQREFVAAIVGFLDAAR
jgi:3-oxoadipate enol-lactonase